MDDQRLPVPYAPLFPVEDVVVEEEAGRLPWKVAGMCSPRNTRQWRLASLGKWPLRLAVVEAGPPWPLAAVVGPVTVDNSKQLRLRLLAAVGNSQEADRRPPEALEALAAVVVVAAAVAAVDSHNRLEVSRH